MQVAIFTEGGPGKGYGHLTRCAALGTAFQDSGARVCVFFDGPEDLVGIFDGLSAKAVDWIKEEVACHRILAQTDIAVFDSYNATSDFYEKLLTKKNLRAVFFDDDKRIDYPPGYLVNGSAEPTWYRSWEGRGYKILAGMTYQPLRRSFWNCPARICRPKADRVLLTLGGDDIRRLLPRLFLELPKLLPTIQLTVVNPYHSRTFAELETLVKPPHRLIVDADADTLVRIFQDSDIAISAGGQTVYELARTGLPAILLLVVENQDRNIAAWLKSGFVSDVLAWTDPYLVAKLAEAIRRLAPVEIRQERAMTGQILVDGQGARRTVGRVKAGI